MKRMAVYGIAVVLMAACAAGCGKGSYGGLKYGDIVPGDWLQANVVDAKTMKRAMWFQIFDQKGDDSIVSYYKKSSETVAGYPANVNKDKWIWILINNRIEIRLLADDEHPDFQKTEKLAEFLKRFDLTGLSKIDGAKVQGSALRKYMPKLGS
ncbi:MAG TPA: hypothetical protein PKM65_03250 [Spirochaetota bacterium]|nr:hypothetical protein [Spirochaetota bacterium]HNT10900.1 hypothetical protein [Spirochaetota bacterium]HNV47773.1 hypothetical protein [Spirochaetota bacterium]HOS41142.1 hypothetical protein [Spirochaetota bacterium]HPI23213.1 hypothetical protein [Spirochaetota bacterium]